MDASKNTSGIANDETAANEHKTARSVLLETTETKSPTCKVCGETLDSEAAICPSCDHRVDDAPDYDTPDGYLYEAFISYRHTPRDSKVAKNLQRLLEGFVIPPEFRNGNKERHFKKLFRDEDELPTSPSLSARIRDALKHSRFLIVVCSADTVESRWVGEEARLFASYHGRSQICIALTEGEVEDNVPKFLLSKYSIDNDGNIATLPCDPLAADFRQDDKKQQKQEALRIAAMMLGCGLDDLKQRSRTRRLHMITAGTSSQLAR